ELLAIHQRRFAVAPWRDDTTEILGQTPLPNKLAVRSLQTSDPATHADHVESIAIDGRSAARSFLRLGHPLLHLVPQRGQPELFAASFREGPHHLLAIAMAHPKQLAVGHGGRAIATPQPVDPPSQRRSLFG